MISEAELLSRFETGEYGTLSEKVSGYGGGSLFVRIRKSGVEFNYRYKADDKQKMLKIGKHHLYKSRVGITLEEARIQVRKISEEKEREGTAHLAEDYRLVKEKKKVRAKEKTLSNFTFKEMLENFLEQHAKKKKSYSDFKSAFNCHVLIHKNIVSKKAKNITEDDIIFILKKMIFCNPDKPNEPYVRNIVNKVRAHLHNAFQWAKKIDRSPIKSDDKKYNIMLNPVSDIDPLELSEEVNGKEQFTDRELWIYWNHSIQVMGMVGYLSRMLLLLGGVRQEQLLRTRWKDVYVDLETQPDHIILITNKGRDNRDVPYVIPLNSLARSELEKIRELTGDCEYIFAGRRVKGKDSGKPMSNSFDKQIKKMHRFMIDDLQLTDSSLPNLGRFRTSITTRAKEAGCDPFIFEKIQMHNQPNNVVKKHYDRYHYINEKKENLDKWQSYVEKIIGQEYEKVTNRLPEHIVR